MSVTVFKNIGAIVGADIEPPRRRAGKEMDTLPLLSDAWMEVRSGRILRFGPMSAFESAGFADTAHVVDLKGEWVFPSFCDSHTHIVYAGERCGEFIDKIHGLSYEQIAARGGGILNSADLLHATSEDELLRQAMTRVNEMIAKGTGAIEIKSGYGLSVDDELKMLRVIRRIAGLSPVEVKATFLGAHAVARAYTGRIDEYVDLVCREMIPEVGRQQLAD